MSNLGNKAIFAENLLYYVERSGKTQRELAEIVGVSAPTFNEWTKAKKYPRIDKIEMLSRIFGILKSDLIEARNEERMEMQKNNDIIANAVVRMRNDEVFLTAVHSIYNMDTEKLKGLLTFLK